MNECKKWFEKAIALDEGVVQRATMDDPHLKRLWDSMGGTLWKRTEWSFVNTSEHLTNVLRD